MDENTICKDLGCGCHRTYHPERDTHACHQDLLLSLELLNEDGSIEIKDSPWTGSGSITIEHKNVIEGTEELRYYQLKIDNNGHIFEIGEPLDIVSEEKDGLLPSYSEDNISDELIEEDDIIYNVTKRKYVKLPETAFKDTVYEDGESGWVLRASQDEDGNNIKDTYATKEDYQTKITSSNKISSDFIDDSVSGNKFVTASEKTVWNGKANINDIPTKTSELTNDSGFIDENSIEAKLKSYSNYDETKTQVLKHINGSFIWVEE